jgi:predicted DNA-binding antitoxin AbrB/MazE fold protein
MMSKIIEAVYDGEVLRPDEPLELQPNTRVRLIIDKLRENPSKPQSFLRTARSLNLQGPSDWSERIEEYLYEDRTDGQN